MLKPERWNTKTRNAGILKLGMPQCLNPERRNTKTRNARILKPGTPEYLNPECRNTSTLNDDLIYTRSLKRRTIEVKPRYIINVTF